MKPAISYGLRGSCFSNRWGIFAITTETGGRLAKAYRRDEHGNASNATTTGPAA